jgi:hypothetical protein
LDTVPEPMIEPSTEFRVLAQVRDERAEIEGHVDAGIGAAEGLAVEIDLERAVELAALPPLAEFRGGNEDGREGRGGLGLEEAEALGEFARDKVAQGDVVDETDEQDVLQSCVSGNAAGHVAGHHHHFGLEVAAPAFVGERDRTARRQHFVGRALVHQGIGPEAFGHLGAACLSDELDVVHISRAVGPLVGARQGRERVPLVEAHHRDRLMGEVGGEQLELRRHARPVVEGGLQRRRDMGGIRAPGEIVAHHHQPAVAASLERSEFHSTSVIARSTATRQSTVRRARLDCFASLAMTGNLDPAPVASLAFAGRLG